LFELPRGRARGYRILPRFTNTEFHEKDTLVCMDTMLLHAINLCIATHTMKAALSVRAALLCAETEDDLEVLESRDHLHVRRAGINAEPQCSERWQYYVDDASR
jgi:hypothetical protein